MWARIMFKHLDAEQDVYENIMLNRLIQTEKWVGWIYKQQNIFDKKKNV